jgi:hypothetical protein
MPKDNITEISKGTRFKSGAQAVENGRKGGIISQQVQREKRTLRQMVEIFGTMGVSDEAREKMEQMGVPEELQNRFMQGVVALFNKANKGDVYAFNAIRDIIGEKPVDETKLTGALDTSIQIGFVETGIEPVSSESEVDAG